MQDEFLPKIDDDENGTSVFLTVHKNGNAYLKISTDDGTFYYHLPPNESGLKNAQAIINGIINKLYK